MAKLEFGDWIWQWHACQSPDIQEHLEKEIVGEGWLFRQPAAEQKKILEGAPERFMLKIMGRLKPETVIALGYNPYQRRLK